MAAGGEDDGGASEEDTAAVKATQYVDQLWRSVRCTVTKIDDVTGEPYAARVGMLERVVQFVTQQQLVQQQGNELLGL